MFGSFFFTCYALLSSFAIALRSTRARAPDAGGNGNYKCEYDFCACDWALLQWASYLDTLALGRPTAQSELMCYAFAI